MSSRRRTSPAVLRAADGGVPGWDTGPAGRVAFVTREIADLWRELTGHARPTPDPDHRRDSP
jgi:hypothetical protein